MRKRPGCHTRTRTGSLSRASRGFRLGTQIHATPSHLRSFACSVQQQLQAFIRISPLKEGLSGFTVLYHQDTPSQAHSNRPEFAGSGRRVPATPCESPVPCGLSAGPFSQCFSLKAGAPQPEDLDLACPTARGLLTACFC